RLILLLVVVPLALVSVVPAAELIEPLLEEVGGERRAEQIVRRALVPAPARLRAGRLPVAGPAVAAPEPRERDELDLLIGLEIADRAAHLADDGIARIVREDLPRPVVGRVRYRHAFLHLELTYPVDDETHRVRVHFEQHQQDSESLRRRARPEMGRGPPRDDVRRQVIVCRET